MFPIQLGQKMIYCPTIPTKLAPMLIQACEMHYLQSQHDFDKYHDGIWLDKYRNQDKSLATFTRNNKISRYQRNVYGRYDYLRMDDIPF